MKNRFTWRRNTVLCDSFGCTFGVDLQMRNARNFANYTHSLQAGHEWKLVHYPHCHIGLQNVQNHPSRVVGRTLIGFQAIVWGKWHTNLNSFGEMTTRFGWILNLSELFWQPRHNSWRTQGRRAFLNIFLYSYHDIRVCGGCLWCLSSESSTKPEDRVLTLYKKWFLWNHTMTFRDLRGASKVFLSGQFTGQTCSFRCQQVCFTQK